MGNASSISATQQGYCLGLPTPDTQLLQASWRSIPDKFALSSRIFTECFATVPQIRDIFGINVPNDQLNTDPDFQRHIRTYATFIDSLIEAIPDEGIILRKSRKVGLFHADMVMRRPNFHFKPEYWSLLTKITVKTIISDAQARKKHTGVVWDLFLQRVILEMQVSFYRHQLNVLTVEKNGHASDHMTIDDVTVRGTSAVSRN